MHLEGGRLIMMKKKKTRRRNSEEQERGISILCSHSGCSLYESQGSNEQYSSRDLWMDEDHHAKKGIVIESKAMEMEGWEVHFFPRLHVHLMSLAKGYTTRPSSCVCVCVRDCNVIRPWSHVYIIGI